MTAGNKNKLKQLNPYIFSPPKIVYLYLLYITNNNKTNINFFDTPCILIKFYIQISHYNINKHWPNTVTHKPNNIDM